MKTNRKRPTTLEPISAAMFVIVSLHVGAVFGVWWWWQNVGSLQRDARTSQLAWMNPGDFKSQMPLPSSLPRPKTAAVPPKASPKPPAAAPKPSADPPVQKATLIAAPPQQHQMEPVPNTTGAPLFAGTAGAQTKPSANRSITLRRAPEKRTGTAVFGAPVPPMTSPTLMDIARLNTLRPSAIPPPSSTTPATVEVDLDTVDEAVIASFLIGWTAPPIENVPEGQREGRMNISIGKDGTVLKAQMNKFSGSHVLDQSILEAAANVKKISTTLPSNYSKDSYDLELNFLLLP
ncbi:MAG: TonB C-terminal domain-containing protein [Prosthecobacter sp.]|uniref:TonB C-terminal domain-containing protein n=1 Tax=Prosthecobacter sp. TaxID=1965333 RepID=UPI0026055E1F|nr:TonB C-terminal domain-containing protein [Prosthecobacter sp.]MCF7789972.1 TonB C-terminal domain-containing protein [Prosthecobacter sp.]